MIRYADTWADAVHRAQSVTELQQALFTLREAVEDDWPKALRPAADRLIPALGRLIVVGQDSSTPDDFTRRVRASRQLVADALTVESSMKTFDAWRKARC